MATDGFREDIKLWVSLDNQIKNLPKKPRDPDKHLQRESS